MLGCLQTGKLVEDWIEDQVKKIADNKCVLSPVTKRLPIQGCRIGLLLVQFRWRAVSPFCHPAVCLSWRQRVVPETTVTGRPCPQCSCEHRCSSRRWGCKLSQKLFVGRDYVVKHVRLKHTEKVEDQRNKVRSLFSCRKGGWLSHSHALTF